MIIGLVPGPGCPSRPFIGMTFKIIQILAFLIAGLVLQFFVKKPKFQNTKLLKDVL
jgi:hypothetical protein